MWRNLLFLLLGLGATSAHGAALHVPHDYATINAALDAATSGDSVLVAPGTYSDYETRVLQGGGPFTASSVAFLKGGVSLIGEGGREVTRIDLAGQGVGKAVPVLGFDLGPGVIVVQGFTITGAPVGNAGIWSRFLDRMIIRDCRVVDLDGGTGSPGGIYSETADLEIHETEFLGCRASSVPYGQAAIAHVEGDLVLEDCRFEGCVGRLVIDLNADGVSPPFDAAVQGCEFRSNIGLAAQVTSFINLTVEDCAFIGNAPLVGPSALVLSGWIGGINEPGPYVVRNNLFALNSTTSGIGTFNLDRVSGVVEGNTFVGNQGRGLTLTPYPQHVVEIRQNIFAWTSAAAIKHASSQSPPPVTTCNDFWANAVNTEGFSPGPTDFLADPQFCDRANGNYTLMSSSPCLPPNSGSCGQVGAFGQGCGAVSVEAETWARTKAKYREDHQPPPASAR